MDDTINFPATHAAFRLIVHCDAREALSVHILGEKDADGKLVEKIDTQTIKSSSRIANGAELTIFTPVSLQPLTDNVARGITERLESNKDSPKSR